eukprot:CAMPEP_0196581246 /NCGR_PEP_ID=MMETSP1081-20130531/33141_1 /TAXON_ID=36882 /ORGANISM="Pyramimonas amylifera, Strain CCMP720" /LENGTH=330 /DNA_ID=CAMNT_0041901401 /DNA_START=44 /DNA_END=1036 /DNA_ORIENTATION=+
MGAIDESIIKCDSLIEEFLGKLSNVAMEDIPKLQVDPDDRWASTINPPPCVYKVRCPKSGYLLTKPFENQCPMPGVFQGDISYLDSMLKPVLQPKEEVGAKDFKSSGKETKIKTVEVEDKSAKEGGEKNSKKKEKKDKPEKKSEDNPKPAGGAATPGNEKTEAFGKALLVIGQVVEVGFVENSDKLYMCKVNVGSEVRQVITGLRKHVSVEELSQKKVVVICNLKVAKLAGQNSEAMIMATEFCDESGPDGKVVKLLGAPQDAAVGEGLFMEGCEPASGCPKTLKTHFWETVKTNLRVIDGQGTFDGKPLKVASGPITSAAGVPNGSEIK